MKIKVLLLLAFTLVVDNLFSQTENSLINYGILIDGNIGLNYLGHYDFKSDKSKGQELLGTVGKHGDQFITLESGDQGSTGEIGFEAAVMLKKGIMLTFDYNSAKSIWSGLHRTEEFQVEGEWRGKGISVGVGYGEILGSDKPFFFAGSVSIGRYNSRWRFYNDDSDDPINFGLVSIPYETSESFFSNNYYLDLNIKGGPNRFLGKGKSNASFNSTLSLGYRQSINRGNWVWNRTGETVQEINGTLMMGFYLKLTIGFGLWNKVNESNNN